MKAEQFYFIFFRLGITWKCSPDRHRKFSVFRHHRQLFRLALARWLSSLKLSVRPLRLASRTWYSQQAELNFRTSYNWEKRSKVGLRPYYIILKLDIQTGRGAACYVTIAYSDGSIQCLLRDSLQQIGSADLPKTGQPCFITNYTAYSKSTWHAISSRAMATVFLYV